MSIEILRDRAIPEEPSLPQVVKVVCSRCVAAVSGTRDRDVTDLVKFDLYAIDGENLPLDKCICGKEFRPWVEGVLSVHRDSPWVCPSCGTKLYFRLGITVFQVEAGTKPRSLVSTS